MESSFSFALPSDLIETILAARRVWLKFKIQYGRAFPSIWDYVRHFHGMQFPLSCFILCFCSGEVCVEENAKKSTGVFLSSEWS